MASLGIAYENHARESDAKLLEKHVEAGLEFTAFPQEIKNAIANLWLDGGVKKCFERRNEYQLNDSAL
uniref:Uncharacterized protein n=2 Tax=Panagrolaimus TaxID=55784 RepID=A0A914QUX5_9BILA